MKPGNQDANKNVERLQEIQAFENQIKDESINAQEAYDFFNR